MREEPGEQHFPKFYSICQIIVCEMFELLCVLIPAFYCGLVVL